MDPFQWTGADVQLSLSGHDLADIYPLLGIPGPPTPPYNISGKLHRESGVWKFVQSKWHVGDSDLTGDVLVDTRRKPGHLTAKLVSQKLVFADLAPLVGAPPDKPGGNVSPQQRQTQQQLEATGDLFPNVPLKVEKLRAMNMDVTLDAKRVIAPAYLPVQALVLPRRGAGRRGDGQAAHPDPAGRRPERGRRQDRGRAGGRRQDRHAQGAHQPGAERHRAAQLLPQVALLRRHLRQGAGPRRAGRHRPLARPGHGHGRRLFRGWRWAAARSRA